MIVVAILLAGALAPLAPGAALAPHGARLWSLWALGAIAIGVVVVLCLAAQLPLAVAAFVLAIAVVASAPRLWSIVRESADASRTEWLLRIWLLVLLGCGILITLAVPVVDHDAVAIWHRKVLDFLASTRFDGWVVPFYPPLGAVLWGLPLAAAGPEYETAGRCVFIAFYVASVATLRECCTRPLSPAAALVIGAIALAGFDHRFVTSGYQDPFLAAVAGIAAVWLARDLIDARPGAAATGLAMCGVLGLIKAEGLVLGVILVTSWLSVSFLSRRNNAGGVAVPWAGISVFLAGTALWPAIRYAYQTGGYTVVEATSPWLLWTNRDRLPEILGYFRTLRPSVTIPIAAAVLSMSATWGLAPTIRRAYAWLALVVLLYSSATVSVFLLTTAPLDWHLSTLLSRMVGHQLPIWYLILFIAAAWVERRA